jgi:hypothetical protein
MSGAAASVTTALAAEATKAGLPAPEYSEIKRRYASTHAEPQETAATTAGCSRPFKDPAQSVALLHIASPHGTPKSADTMVRVLGLYDSGEAADKAKAALSAAMPGCSLFQLNTCEWYLMSDVTRAPYMVKVKIDRLHELHRLETVKRKIEFEEHRAKMRGERKPTHTTTSPNPVVSEADVAAYEADVKALEAAQAEEPLPPSPPALSMRSASNGFQDDDEQQLHDVPAALEQHSKFVALVVMPDRLDAGREPGLAVLGGFATELEARAYIEHVAKKCILDHDVAVGEMYRWLTLNATEDERVPKIERDAELNRIMAKRGARDSEVQAFKNMCTQLNIDVPYKDVEPDLGEDGKLLKAPEEQEEGTSKLKVVIKSSEDVTVPSQFSEAVSGAGGARAARDLQRIQELEEAAAEGGGGASERKGGD